MNKMKLDMKKLICVLMPIPLGLLAGPIIHFFVKFVVGGMPLFQAFSELLRQDFSPGVYLFSGALASIPFVALTLFLCVYSLFNPLRLCSLMCLSGLLGILALMIPAHVSLLYPIYGPGRISSTAAIGFIFIPFYCLGSMALGLLLGWLISYVPWVRSEEDKFSHRFQTVTRLACIMTFVTFCVWITLERYYHSLYRKAVDKETPIEELLALAQSRNATLRSQVALNAGTPQDSLRLLAQDPKAKISVASNMNTPVDVLKELAQDENWRVRWEVASNKYVPHDILTRLEIDQDERVRRAVQWNRDQQNQQFAGLPLHEAIKDGDEERVRQWIQEGIDVNKKSANGMTGLHWAIYRNHESLATLLMQHGAEINVQDITGWTPLHVAAYTGNITIAQYLLQKGADAGIQNYKGQKPIDIASERNHIQLVEYLKSFGAIP